MAYGNVLYHISQYFERHFVDVLLFREALTEGFSADFDVLS